MVFSKQSSLIIKQLFNNINKSSSSTMPLYYSLDRCPYTNTHF